MQKVSTALTELLNIDFPIIMAPMFLVSNEKMTIEAMNSGIAACIPARNWQTIEQMQNGIKTIKKNTNKGALGINLIIEESNPKFDIQLKACIKLKVDFIISSLINPKKLISECKKHNIKVFCDVRDEKTAIKYAELGADALIAINKDAGAFPGQLDAKELISLLKNNINIPIVSAGGIGDGGGIFNKINDDAVAGCSIGSIFIATEESNVSEAYKKACIKYSDTDIVLTSKINYTLSNFINTPYLKRIETGNNWLKKLLSKSKVFKKWFMSKDLKTLEEAAKKNTYKTLWMAGPSIKHTKKILKTKEIILELTERYQLLEKKKRLMMRSISRES